MKNIYLAAFLGLAAAAGQAAPLTPQQALQRALDSAPQLVRKRLPAKAPADYELKYTSMVPGTQDRPGCYLFKSPQGYVVASADDRALGLLAYGDSVSVDNMSPELEWWLGEYGRQMAAAPDEPSTATAGAPEMEGYAAIKPLCHTRWSQFAPYYDDCSKAYGQPVVTGCVSTAMAQVMKAHNWPKGPCTGGTHTYTWDHHTFSFDYDGVVFQWDLMKDGYMLPGTPEQRAAVAELFYAVGVSVDMHYHPGGSAANPGGIPGALMTYFDYDRGAAEIFRDYYGLQEWNILIYNQLKDYGPVQYSGWTPSGGGHSFVCDGYSHDGFFHINWGWAEDDGYYRLTALAADHKGEGGIEAEGGFDFNQDVIINIKPAGETDKGQLFINLLNSSDVAVGQAEVSAGQPITIHGAYWNRTLGTLEGTLGLKAVSAAGDTIYLSGPELSDYRHGEGRRAYDVTLPSSVPDGEYRLYPAFLTEGQWHDYRTAVDAKQYVEMSVTGSGSALKATFAALPADTISATSLQLPAAIEYDKGMDVRFTLSNNGPQEYFGHVTVGFFTLEGKLLGQTMPIACDIPANGTQGIDVGDRVLKWEGDTVPPSGEVLAYVLSSSGKPVSAPVKLQLEGAQVETGVPALPPSPFGCSDGIEEPEVWTLNGLRLTPSREDASRLAPGLYILRYPDGRTVKRLVR